MLAVPADRPVTVPSVATEARVGTLLLHVPPAVASVRLTVEPTHIGALPVIAVIGLTVTTTVFWQLAPVIYDINAVPPLTPVTTPVVGATVATATSSVLQVPPVTLLCSVIVEPWHTGVLPVNAPGVAFTVTIVVTWQPPATIL